MEEHSIYLSKTALLDHDQPDLRAFADKAVGNLTDPIAKAVAIHDAVRDHWQYTATKISFREDDLKASSLLQRKEGHCIEKASFMIACCRAHDIPARLCLAKVKNHIAAEDVERVLGTDELVPHGYLEAYLDGKWVKATPAFNKELCQKLGVDSLEFDGRTDALFQQYSKAGGVFMEYLDDYGHFEDVPLDYIIELMRQHYPVLVKAGFPIERGGYLALG